MIDGRVYDTAQLATVAAFYDRGLYLQAYGAALELGPLNTWQGVSGRVIAGRLATTLGASRLGTLLHRLAWREHPADPESALFAAYALRAERGPWSAFCALRNHESLLDRATLVQRAHFLALRASIAAEFRDFSQAESFLADAYVLEPSDAWLRVERAGIHELNDDYASALAATEEALEIRPAYRPAINQRARFLLLLNRDDEAMEMLLEARNSLESASVCAALLDMQIERGLFREAEDTLARVEMLSPLSDKVDMRWQAARRSDVRYHLGDRVGAACEARQVGGDFYSRLAERLEDPALEQRRVLLDVPFVRQHHLTCAPATLSAIASFWGRPVEHLSVADSICYDGTPNQSSRAWAEQNGWRVREFSVNWESAVSLLERRVPFTLSTVDPGNAHMQAVIGYDNARGTFLIRDPYLRQIGEFGVQALMEKYAASGPHCMAFVPIEDSVRLDDIELPDAALYDDYYRIQSALLTHDRAKAKQVVSGMMAVSPAHRLTLVAQRALADYDSDEIEQLRLNDVLLKKYPKEVNLRLSHQSLLSQLGRRDECMDYLSSVCQGSDSHPLLCLAYADLLRDDARQLPRARLVLLRVLRAIPLKAEAYHKLAHVLWGQDERDTALEMYRIASNLDSTNEQYADSHFRAARYLRQTDTALAFLVRRFEQFGKRSSQPATTLFEALDVLDRTAEGLERLKRALEWRPNDGELLLFCCEAWLSNGDVAHARVLLDRAHPLARSGSWLQSLAGLEEAQGNLDEALDAWSKVAKDEPLNLSAARAVVRLRCSLAGDEYARDYLREKVARFPYHHGLNSLYVEWLEGEPLEVIELALRTLIAINPADANGWRKLAISLSQSDRIHEAFGVMDKALELAPNELSSHTAHARLLSLDGRREEARVALRQGLCLSVDSSYAMRELIDLCHSAEERIAELAFIHGELMRQVTFGDGLLSYQEVARTVLVPEELLATLRDAHAQRSDLWHACVALAIQLRDMGENEEAAMVLQDAVERFALLPRVWLEKSRVEHSRSNPAGEEAALLQALQLSPSWDRPARYLADVYQGQERYEEARAVLSQALRHNPRNGVLHGWLADVLWIKGERGAAMGYLEQALRLEPDYLWAWRTLVNFSSELRDIERPLRLAQELVGSRPNDVRNWLLLARAEHEAAAALEAVRRALVIAPRSEPAHELRIDLLLRKGDPCAALDATQDAVWSGTPPASLMLRRAQMLAERGEKEAAMATLEASLAREHDHFAGWTQLADWYLDVERKADYLEASRSLLRLEPGNHISHGYFGDALLINDDRMGGKKTLRRALELNPSYDWAFYRLFDLELEDKEMNAAASVLALIERHVAVEVIALARLRLASANGQRAEAVEAFESLSLSPCQSDDVFDRARTTFREAGELPQLNALLERLVMEPETNPRIGRLWGECCGAKVRPRQLFANLETLLARGDIGVRAAVSCMHALADSKAKGRPTLRRLLRRLNARLHQHIDTWGAAGYALITLGLERECARWMADWKVREDIEPWMLLNVAAALRGVGRWQEANAASQHALRLNAVDCGAQHRLLLALDAGLDGDARMMDHYLELTADAQLSVYYSYLRELNLALRASMQGKHPENLFQDARSHLHRGLAIYPAYSQDKYLARAHRLVLWRIAGTRSSFPLLRAWWFLGLL